MYRANAQSNAGIVLQALNDNTLSIQLLEQTASRIAKQFGEKHLQYGAALHQLTQAHFLGGDFAKALESSTTAYEIFKEHHGEDHAQTKEVGKNAELLKAVVDNVERQKAAQEQMRQQHLERLSAAQVQARAPAAAAPANGARNKRVLAGANRQQVAQAVAAINEAAKNGVPAALAAAQAAGIDVSKEVAEAAKAAENGAAGAGAGATEGPAIGERGHLDVDELVKYIQGNTPSKPARGAKNNLRGKRRTGAKR